MHIAPRRYVRRRRARRAPLVVGMGVLVVTLAAIAWFAAASAPRGTGSSVPPRRARSGGRGGAIPLPDRPAVGGSSLCRRDRREERMRPHVPLHGLRGAHWARRPGPRRHGGLLRARRLHVRRDDGVGAHVRGRCGARALLGGAARQRGRRARGASRGSPSSAALARATSPPRATSSCWRAWPRAARS